MTMRAGQLAVVLVLCGACGGEARKSAPPPAPAVAPPPAPKIDKPPRLIEARTLDRAELQELLDAWLAAQNSGDFAAYEALYAPQMRGVKRVANRAWEMDRAQWMADRARMFKKKMEVEIHSVTFRSLMATAVIEFVQVFHSGKFMDSGPKKLMVALHEGLPRIVHEEMLRSEVMLQADAFRDRVHLVFEIGDASYAVLAQKAELSWGTGPFAEADPSEGIDAYVQAVDASRVPQAERWLATSLRVHDAQGTACSAHIEALELVVRTDDWTFGDDDTALFAKLDAAHAEDARARAILREEPAMLVGRLSACSGVLATPESERAAPFYLKQPLDQALQKAALDAAKALPEYTALQAQWEKVWKGLYEDLGPDDRPGEWGGDGSVQVFGAARGARFALVGFGNSGLEGDMPETLTILYRIEDQGTLTLVRVSSGSVAQQLLLDLNGDEVPEILGADALHGFGSYGLFLIQAVHHAYNGCTC